MESQPQNPEFRNNPKNVHPYNAHPYGPDNRKTLFCSSDQQRCRPASIFMQEDLS